MLTLFVVLFAALSALNYGIARNPQHPPFVFASFWTATLLFLLVAGDAFYEVSGGALSIYLGGAIAFTVGGFIASRTQKDRAARPPVTPGRAAPLGQYIIFAMLLGLLVALPFYWAAVRRLSATVTPDNYFRGVRMAFLDLPSVNTNPIDRALFSLPALASLVALIAFVESDGARTSRIRAYVAAAMALVYELSLSQSSGAIGLIVSMMGLLWVTRGRISGWTVTIAGFLFFASFAVPHFLLHQAYLTDASAVGTTDFVDTLKYLQWYACGGVVGFDTVVNHPHLISSTGGISRTFFEVLNKFGAGIEVPSLYTEYTAISPEFSGNVYTIYFSYYPDFGWPGVIVIMSFLGWLTTTVFHLAQRGYRLARLFHAQFFAAIMLSAFSEYFFYSINTFFKTFLLAFAVYSLPKVIGHISGGAGRATGGLGARQGGPQSAL